MVELYAFTCGWLTGPLGAFLRGEHGRLRVPVPSYLVVHPRGRLIFDSGLHPAMATNAPARIVFRIIPCLLLHGSCSLRFT